MRPGGWSLPTVDIWVDVLLEARVRSGAWNLLVGDTLVDVWRLGCGLVLVPIINMK